VQDVDYMVGPLAGENDFAVNYFPAFEKNSVHILKRTATGNAIRPPKDLCAISL
jgi:hypothetical protein